MRDGGRARTPRKEAATADHDATDDELFGSRVQTAPSGDGTTYSKRPYSKRSDSADDSAQASAAGSGRTEFPR